MKKRFVSFVLAVMLIYVSVPFSSVNAYAIGNYGVDIYGPSYTSSDNPFNWRYFGQCTWYCWGRAHEKGVSLSWGTSGYGNAMDWYTNAKNSGRSM